MTRTPPRLPLPCRPHLTLRTPPLPGIRSPASGLCAMKSTNSNRSSSVQSAPAWRMNTAVSATVIGRVRIRGMYANGALFSRSAAGVRTADFVHDPGAALHEDLWALARATGDGLGRAARMGTKKPARDPRDGPAG